MKQKNLYLLVGAPGSGKSTWLHNNAKDGIIVSRDKIRFSLVNEEDAYFSQENEVFNRYIQTIQDALNSSVNNIYADATQLNEKARNKVLDKLDLSNVKNLYAVVLRPSLQETLKRNAQRSGRLCVPEIAVRRMYNSYTDPAKDKKYTIKPIYIE